MFILFLNAETMAIIENARRYNSEISIGVENSTLLSIWSPFKIVTL